MLLKQQKFYWTVFILFLLSSCTSIYLPTTVIPTGFQDKGETQISGSINGRGIYTNLAYSPIKHLYISGSGAYFPTASNSLLTSSYFTREKYNLSGGIGLYFPIERKWIIESLVGYGGGQFQWQPRYELYGNSLFSYASGYYYHLNGMLALTYNYNEMMSFSIAYRQSELDLLYRNTQSYGNYNNNQLDNKLINFSQGGPYFVLKYKNYQSLNYFGSVGIEKTSLSNDIYSHALLYLRLGLEFHLVPKKKKRKK